LSKLANLSSTIENARKILGKKNSFAWQVFDLVNGKRKSSEIAKLLRKHESNVSLKLGYLEDMGIIVEFKKIGNATIYKKLPELKNLKHTSRESATPASTNAGQHESTKSNSSTNSQLSTITNKVVEIGKQYGIENIDKNWIDSLILLNFMETVCTKFLMDHGIDESTVQTYKWEKKFSQLRAILFKEAKTGNFTIRDASVDFFKSFNSTRNAQDHVAHLPSSKVHKSDLDFFFKCNRTLMLFDDFPKIFAISLTLR